MRWLHVQRSSFNFASTRQTYQTFRFIFPINFAPKILCHAIRHFPVTRARSITTLTHMREHCETVSISTNIACLIESNCIQRNIYASGVTSKEFAFANGRMRFNHNGTLNSERRREGERGRTRAFVKFHSVKWNPNASSLCPCAPIVHTLCALCYE